MSGSEIVLICVLVVAMMTDVRTGKIKNWLTLPAIVAGPFIHLIQGGAHESLVSLAGLGAMIVVGAVLVVFGFLGGGDIKLLVAVGSLAGLPMIKDVLLFTALAGGVVAIILMIVRRRALGFIGELTRAIWFKIGLGVSAEGAVRTSTKMPYSVAIAAGTIAAMIWGP